MNFTLAPVRAPYTEGTCFEGTVDDQLLGSYYLKLKHPKECILLPISKKNLDWEIIWYAKGNQIEFPKQFRQKLQQCIKQKKRFTLVPIVLLKSKKSSTGHANLLLIDHAKNNVERFEPYGSAIFERNTFREKTLDSTLKKYFKERGYQYFQPIDFLPHSGPQFHEEMLETINVSIRRGDPFGFCMAWSLWWADLRMNFPNIQRKELAKYALKRLSSEPITIRKFIRNYTANILDTLSKHFNLKEIKNRGKQKQMILTKIYQKF